MPNKIIPNMKPPRYDFDDTHIGDPNYVQVVWTKLQQDKNYTSIKSSKSSKYSSTEQYLLHRIADLEEENEMLKRLYIRVQGE